MTGQLRKSRGRRGHLRDAALVCTEVLAVPGSTLRCELDAGHLEKGEKHKSGCTRWGRPKQVTP